VNREELCSTSLIHSTWNKQHSRLLNKISFAVKMSKLRFYSLVIFSLLGLSIFIFKLWASSPPSLTQLRHFEDTDIVTLSSGPKHDVPVRRYVRYHPRHLRIPLPIQTLPPQRPDPKIPPHPFSRVSGSGNHTISLQCRKQRPGSDP